VPSSDHDVLSPFIKIYSEEVAEVDTVMWCFIFTSSRLPQELLLARHNNQKFEGSLPTLRARWAPFPLNKKNQNSRSLNGRCVERSNKRQTQHPTAGIQQRHEVKT